MALAGTTGTVSFVGNSPLLTGSFSGLDTAAIIEASMAVKRIPIDRLENKISITDTRIAAFNEFKTLLNTLQAAVNGLRNPPGSAGILSNVFEQKAAFVSSSTSTPATDILGATTTNNAQAGTYEIEVLQIAQAHKVSGAALADVSTALGVTETITVGLDGGTTAAIDITADMTASEVVFAINAVTATTGVRASALKVAEGDYRIVFTAEETNKAIQITGDNGGATLAALSASADNGATYTTELAAHQPAQLRLDNIATIIERDSNEIDDLIDNVTLDLFKADDPLNGTIITLEIENDLSAAKGQVEAFVTAYNDVKAFLLSQQEVSEDGEIGASAILFGDNLLRSLGRDLGLDLAQLVDGVASGALATLRSVGIEFDDEGMLTIDSGVLDANLVDKLDEVRAVFEFGFQTSSPDVRLLSRNRLLDVGSFTITDPGGAIDGTNLQVGGVDAFEVDGSVLRGLEGTIYEGMSMAYTRDTADAAAPAKDITITTTLGIAERLYQRLDDYVNVGDGLITEEVIRLTSQNETTVEKIAALESRLLIYQNMLISKYAAMEQAIARAQAVGDQLEAFLKAGDD
ncbi:MAG TPA: flagellar filament capping protein FliD [Kiloniellaceae bacterium]